LRSVLEQTGIGMERVRFVELEALQRGALPALIADMAAALGQPARVSG